MQDIGETTFDAGKHFLCVRYSGTRAASGKIVIRFFTTAADAREQFALADTNGKYALLCDRVANPNLGEDNDLWYAFDWSERLKFDYTPRGRGVGFDAVHTKISAKRLPKRYEPLDGTFVRPVAAPAK